MLLEASSNQRRRCSTNSVVARARASIASYSASVAREAIRDVGYELYYYKHAPAVVIVSGALGDDASKKSATELAKLKAEYEAKGVVFMMLNSSLDDSRDEIIAKAKDLGVPMLADELQLVGVVRWVLRNRRSLRGEPEDKDRRLK